MDIVPPVELVSAGGKITDTCSLSNIELSLEVIALYDIEFKSENGSIYSRLGTKDITPIVVMTRVTFP